MTVSYALKDYSRGRTTVMGIATAMILWFHFEYPMAAGTAAEFIKLICDLGVDLFLLASGVGMYFALEKHRSYASFLGSRLRRIMPVYLLVSVPWFVYLQLHNGSRDWVACLMNISTLSFWLKGDLTCWYVAGILALYLVTPWYAKLWKRWEMLNRSCILAMYVLLTAMLLEWVPNLFGHTFVLMGRVPIYLLGLSMGKAIREERTLQISIPGALVIMAACVYVVASAFGRTGLSLNWNFKYLAYGPLAALASLALAKFPDCRPVRFLGQHSLEVYLVFEKVQAWLADQPWMFPVMERSQLVRPLLAVVVTLPVAWFLQILCNGIFYGKLRMWVLDKSSAGK